MIYPQKTLWYLPKVIQTVFNDSVWAFRGTQTLEPRRDWANNFARMAPTPLDDHLSHNENIRKLAENYKAKYGSYENVRTTGHSLGGASAMYGAELTKTKSVTFDPVFTSRKIRQGLMDRLPGVNNPVEHVAIRQFTDGVSALTPLLGKNVKIKNIRTSKTAIGEIQNPLTDAHDMNHFTMSDYLQSKHGEDQGLRRGGMRPAGGGIEMQDISPIMNEQEPLMKYHLDRITEFGSLHDNIPADDPPVINKTEKVKAGEVKAADPAVFDGIEMQDTIPIMTQQQKVALLL